MGCENNCVNEHRLKKIEEDFKEFRDKNSKDHKEFFNRLEDVEKDMISSKSDREHINTKSAVMLRFLWKNLGKDMKRLLQVF